MMTESLSSGRFFPGWHAAARPEAAAVIEAGTGRVRTYREVDALANQTSHLLRELGLDVGDHVALWFDNDLDYPALWWGARYAGLYYTLISTRLTPPEAAHIINDSGAKVVLLGARLAAEHGAALGPLVDEGTRLVVDGDQPDGLRPLLAAQSTGPLPDRVEGIPMLYSSGTTGQPKAVKRTLSGAALGTTTTGVALAQRFGIDGDAVYLAPAPLYHAAPCAFVSATLALGGTVVLMDHFDAEAFLSAVDRFAVTHAQVVPTMFVRLLALPQPVKDAYALTSLRCAVHAGAPCPVPVKQAILDWWGPVVHEYYSGTESVGLTVCGPQEWLAQPGTVGLPIGCAVHIVDDGGVELPAGHTGAVYFSGSGGFAYHNDADKTQDSYLPNGWATFGDIGHVNADGYLFLTDRRANMIIVGGVNIYPQEAENVLISHPLVADAAVFGIPHAEMGEEVKAVVQPAPGVVGDAALEATLIAHCRSHLASTKCPRSIDFSDDLPREPTGKLLKRKLRDAYRAGLSAPTQLALSPEGIA